jgi:hypothetical protein
MEDVKESLSDNDIEFNQWKDWNADCCRELLMRWGTRDDYQIGFLLTETDCIFVSFNG